MGTDNLTPGDVPQPDTEADVFSAFQNLTPDGFIILKPLRDEHEEIIDLEWTFVNKAAGAIIGRRPEDLVGKRLLVEMPGHLDEGLFEAYAAVIKTGTTWQREFHYDHGGIKAWFRTTAAKAGEGLALSFADISEAKQGEERLANIIDGLLAFVGVLSPEGVLLEANEPAVTAAGVGREQLIGVPFWDCYWWAFDADTQEHLKNAIATAAGGARVRYDAEIRIVGDQRIWIDFQIAPVFDANGKVAELIPSGVDITERKRSEAQRELLVNELSHRVKNTLATIQSIAGQTVRHSDTMAEFQSAFSARLRSIAASHDLLVASEHKNAPMKELIKRQVLPYGIHEKCLILKGGNMLLPGDSAYSLGLVLHELAANASKYGAFSSASGVVTVAWRISQEAHEKSLSLTWVERGGPDVKTPVREGFGTRLIERSLASDNGNATLDYAPQGLTVHLRVAL